MRSEYTKSQNRYQQLKHRLKKLTTNGATSRQIAHLTDKLAVAELEYKTLRSRKVWADDE